MSRGTPFMRPPEGSAMRSGSEPSERLVSVMERVAGRFGRSPESPEHTPTPPSGERAPLPKGGERISLESEASERPRSVREEREQVVIEARKLRDRAREERKLARDALEAAKVADGRGDGEAAESARIEASKHETAAKKLYEAARAKIRIGKMATTHWAVLKLNELARKQKSRAWVRRDKAGEERARAFKEAQKLRMLARKELEEAEKARKDVEFARFTIDDPAVVGRMRDELKHRARYIALYQEARAKLKAGKEDSLHLYADEARVQSKLARENLLLARVMQEEVDTSRGVTGKPEFSTAAATFLREAKYIRIIVEAEAKDVKATYMDAAHEMQNYAEKLNPNPSYPEGHEIARMVINKGATPESFAEAIFQGVAGISDLKADFSLKGLDEKLITGGVMERSIKSLKEIILGRPSSGSTSVIEGSINIPKELVGIELGKLLFQFHQHRVDSNASNRRYYFEKAQQWQMKAEELLLEYRRVGDKRIEHLERLAFDYQKLEKELAFKERELAFKESSLVSYEKTMRSMMRNQMLMMAFGGMHNMGMLFNAFNTLGGSVASNAAAMTR